MQLVQIVHELAYMGSDDWRHWIHIGFEAGKSDSAPS